MIRSVLVLRTKPANVDTVLDLYRQQDVLQESLNLTRALASEIAVSNEGDGEIIVTALWPDEVAYQEWVDHPQRGRRVPELPVLLADEEVGVAKLYTIDHAVTKP